MVKSVILYTKKKGYRFDPWSRHIPRLQVQFSEGTGKKGN